MISTKEFLYTFALMVASVLVLAGCSEGASSESAVEEVTSQVAFIYSEDPDEYNMSRLHDIGRQYLDEQLPDLGTKVVQSVSVDDAEGVLRQLAEEGHKLIFATSPDYSDAVLKVAADFPDTKFEVADGAETADNVAAYSGACIRASVAGGYTGEMTVSASSASSPRATVEVIRISTPSRRSLLIRIARHLGSCAFHRRLDRPEPIAPAALELVDPAPIPGAHTYNPEVQKVAEEKACPVGRL